MVFFPLPSRSQTSGIELSIPVPVPERPKVIPAHPCVVVLVLLLLLGVGTLELQQVHTLLSKSLLFDRKESEQSIYSKLGQVQFNANNREYSQQKTPAFDNWQLNHEDLLQIKSHNASSTLDLTHLQQWPYGIRWLFMILKS